MVVSSLICSLMASAIVWAGSYYRISDDRVQSLMATMFTLFCTAD
jgi:hypothetical protein